MPKKRDARATPRVLIREQQKSRAVALKVAGYSYRNIAEDMSCSTGQAHGLVTEALDELIRETRHSVEQHRELEVIRLDAMWRRCWRIIADDAMPPLAVVAALNSAVRISERRSRLHGFDQDQRDVVPAEVALALVDAMTDIILRLAPKYGLPPAAIREVETEFKQLTSGLSAQD